MGDKIIGYVYHHTTPEFLYQCQWVAVPYNGGPVQRRIDTKPLLEQMPYFVLSITMTGYDHEYAHRIGATFAKLFGFAQVQIPVWVPGTNKNTMKMCFPLVESDAETFVKEFKANLTHMRLNNIKVVLDPYTGDNWI